MANNQTVQELKAERVQEEMVALADGTFRLSLKAERVQEPTAVAAGPNAQRSSFEVSLSFQQKQPVRIELPAVEAIITI